ncbi:MAG TPA: EboA domain-containing protein [Parapedobacter sp.]|uniref:EboA domain-containing protein n=1 Tax=Parapedobacter sp. TaxID=1958893 RepID=UPI002B8B10B8|nr:EboA domain-containing protein [Parapedobacter sp.]HWK57800.1 EboA domain-containing protein [Parapedobacter sp.]
MDVNTSEVAAGDTFGRAIKSRLHASAWQWLSAQVDSVAADPNPGRTARVFTSLPRQLKTDGTSPTVSLNETYENQSGLPLVVRAWPMARLARVWLLMRIPKLNEADYVQLIARLFKYGDMEELVALYSALPVYHYPEAWLTHCQEGIRSNIGLVRHAVMVDNPYPAHFLDEDAWNQLVLKAFFTDEDIPHIIGLKRRNNLRLAQALTDYAYERYAAHREINPMLWILVGPFMDGRAFELMERIIGESQVPLEQRAIRYAFEHCNYGGAQQYLKEHQLPASLLECRGTPWEIWDNDIVSITNEDTNQ